MVEALESTAPGGNAYAVQRANMINFAYTGQRTGSGVQMPRTT